MSEHLKSLEDKTEISEQGDVLAIVKKMQQHLVYLEKKIDMLLENQSSGSGQRSFKPRFGGSGRPFNRHRENRGERNFGGRSGFGGERRERHDSGRESEGNTFEANEGRPFQKRGGHGGGFNRGGKKPHWKKDRY